MTWFKVDDRLHDHHKTRQAGPLAMGVWVMAGSWCAANETDGFIPASVVARFAPKITPITRRLESVGLWSSTTRNGEPGYQFHDWDEYQPSSKELQDKRAAARDRMRKYRENKPGTAGDVQPNVQANGQRTSQEVRSTPSRPDPTRPSSLPSLPAREQLAAYGLTDRETTKTLELLHTSLTVGNEDALVRKLIDNGDIDRWIDKARTALEDDTPRHRVPTHDFDDTGNGVYCAHTGCGMPRPHANHKTGRADA
ncbi:hypothetical protein ACGFIY_21205 [Micromonospora chersina]|uniref:hypothetical protein n=1 Tax=Micromonospora chersina TaxID=47854 RepID=UPI0037162585